MANCKNCGASLPPDCIVCEYCGTRNFVDFQKYGAQGHSGRKCAICEDEMISIDIGLNGENLIIEKCETCKGMFFDSGEVEQMLKMYAKDPQGINREKLQKLCENKVSGPKRKAYLPCPVCDQLMNRQLYGKMSAVVMDICHQHGVFFEPGEIRQLIDWKSAGGETLHNNMEATQPKKREPKVTPIPDNDFDWSTRSQSNNLIEALFDAFFDLLRK